MNTTTRTAAIREIKTELSMRRQVWQRIPGSQNAFLDLKKQARYDSLVDLLAVLENITDRDWAAAQGRVAAIISATGEQTKLF